MRLLHDAGRRQSIATALLALTLATLDLIASQTCAQTTGTDRLPPTSRPAAAGSARAAGVTPSAAGRAGAPAARTAAATPTAGGQPATNNTAPAGANPAAVAGGAAAPPPRAPVAPFQLTTREQEQLDKVLGDWEKKNSQTGTFKCNFRRWEYDNTIKAAEAKDHMRSFADGEVKYKRPDHGMFRVRTLNEFNEDKKEYEERTDGLEHWVCDGKDIYEFVPADRKLKVHPLPKEMQGEAIADGPVPFIFGAKAEKMKQRYWIREITPKDEIGKHIWLEVFPKYQHDAMNFDRVTVMLNHSDFKLYGLQIFNPNEQQRTVFIFSKIAINPIDWLGNEFAAPSTPWNWTKEVDPVSEPAEPAAPQPPANPPASKQVKRPAPVTGAVQR